MLECYYWYLLHLDTIVYSLHTLQKTLFTLKATGAGEAASDNNAK